MLRRGPGRRTASRAGSRTRGRSAGCRARRASGPGRAASARRPCRFELGQEVRARRARRPRRSRPASCRAAGCARRPGGCGGRDEGLRDAVEELRLAQLRGAQGRARTGSSAGAIAPVEPRERLLLFRRALRRLLGRDLDGSSLASGTARLRAGRARVGGRRTGGTGRACGPGPRSGSSVERERRRLAVAPSGAAVSTTRRWSWPIGGEQRPAAVRSCCRRWRPPAERRRAPAGVEALALRSAIGRPAASVTVDLGDDEVARRVAARAAARQLVEASAPRGGAR